MDGRPISRSRRRRLWPLFLVALAALTIPAAATAAQPVYIVNYTDGAGGPGSVVKLDPKSGKVKSVAQGAPLVNPSAITVGNNGKLLVSDDGANAIFRVDPGTGKVRKIASGPFVFPFDLEQAADGTIYVTDANAGPTQSGAVFRVDPKTGKVKTVVSGPPLVNPWGLALGGQNKIFLADDNENMMGANGLIFRVNIDKKKVTPLASGGKLWDPTGLQLGPGGDLYTADYGAGPTDTGAVFRVDPGNGKVKTVRIGPPLDENFGIDFNAQGRMFLPETPDANGDQSIIRMNTAGNDLATFTSTKITEPYGVAVGN